MTFLDFLKVKKNYENMLQNAPFKFFFGKAYPRTPLANAWLRYASQPPPKKKIVGPPWKISCIHP